MSATPKISRRALIGGGVVAVAAVPPLAVLGLRGTASPDVVIANYLRRVLPGLAVPDAELLAFIAEYNGAGVHGWRARLSFERMLTIMANPFLEDRLPASYRPFYERRTRHLLTTFLFSTDFFTTAESRPEKTRFIAFADPYAVGCRNPLSEKGLPA